MCWNDTFLCVILQLRLTVAEALGSMSHLMAHDKLEEQLPKLLPTILGLYKKNSEHYIISKVKPSSPFHNYRKCLLEVNRSTSYSIQVHMLFHPLWTVSILCSIKTWKCVIVFALFKQPAVTFIVRSDFMTSLWENPGLCTAWCSQILFVFV